MSLKELAAYLRRDARELERLASRGKIPGQRVGGRWRFQRAEILHWLETRIDTLSNAQLAALEHAGERPGPEGPDRLLISPLLSERTMAVPLPARTRTSVLRRLVQVAEQGGQVYQPEVVLDALLAREQLQSTALEGGVAIPHWRRPLPQTIAASLIAYGRTTTGIPFGAAGGGLTDVFFLLLCRDDRTHLHVLARLARMLQRPELLQRLRHADSEPETYQIIAAAEQELIADDR